MAKYLSLLALCAVFAAAILAGPGAAATQKSAKTTVTVVTTAKSCNPLVVKGCAAPRARY